MTDDTETSGVEQSAPDWMASAVEDKNCSVDGCTTDPKPETGLCGWHENMRRAVSGPLCGRCGNSQWIPYSDVPDPHGVCTACEFVLYSDTFSTDSEDGGAQ